MRAPTTPAPSNQLETAKQHKCPAPASTCPTHLAGLSETRCGPPNRTVTSTAGCGGKSTRSDHARSLGPAGNSETIIITYYYYYYYYYYY